MYEERLQKRRKSHPLRYMLSLSSHVFPIDVFYPLWRLTFRYPVSAWHSGLTCSSAVSLFSSLFIAVVCISSQPSNTPISDILTSDSTKMRFIYLIERMWQGTVEWILLKIAWKGASNILDGEDFVPSVPAMWVFWFLSPNLRFNSRFAINTRNDHCISRLTFWKLFFSSISTFHFNFLCFLGLNDIHLLWRCLLCRTRFGFLMLWLLLLLLRISGL